LTAFDQASINPTGEKEWEKTVTLPSGDVILDMLGEWDLKAKFYGPFFTAPNLKATSKITQEGTTFTGVKKFSSEFLPKGAKTIKGELDKDGFKAVYRKLYEVETILETPTFVSEPYRWEISKNGNRVLLDCGERVKITLTR
jgi:hypothetical protein